MRRIVLGVLILGLVAVALLAASEVQAPVAPKDGELVFSTESVDLGRVPFDQPAPYRFEMRNTGGKPVTIAQPDITALEGC